MENGEFAAPVVEYFSELDDPRRYNQRHYLQYILVIAIRVSMLGPTICFFHRLTAAVEGDILACSSR
jgi:hypothetical protein